MQSGSEGPGVQPYRSTPVFDSGTLPAALRAEHRTKVGVWGLVVVLGGQLKLNFADGRETLLVPDRPGLLLPDQPHWVTPMGEMRMRVDFYHEPPPMRDVAEERPDGFWKRVDLPAEAVGRFKRLMIYIAIAGGFAVLAALAYLAANGVLSVVSAIATTLGVFLSVLVGGGLMAVGFLSSNSGHDDAATGRGSLVAPADSETVP